MKSFYTNLIAVLTVGALGLAAGSAFAGDKGHQGGPKVAIVVGNNGCHNNGNHNNGCHNGSCNNQCQSNGGCNQNSQGFQPYDSTYVVQPGDTLASISLREYGNVTAAQSIAQFNRLPFNAALVPGQRLALPSIGPNGQLTQSTGQGARGNFSPLQSPYGNPTTGYAAPTGNYGFVPTTAPTSFATPTSYAAPTSGPLTSVSAGSVLSLDGQDHGAEQGVVRLRVNNVAMPVTVIEWSANSAKVRLPQLDLASATKAQIEVLRADGSLASTSSVELTPVANRVALGN